MEAIEAAGIGYQARPLGFEHLPDRVVADLRMAMCLGVGDALVEQPGVQLLVGLDPDARREEAFPHQPNLVLDLPLSHPDAGVHATGSTR
jgi:hypothetical protein